MYRKKQLISSSENILKFLMVGWNPHVMSFLHIGKYENDKYFHAHFVNITTHARFIIQNCLIDNFYIISSGYTLREIYIKMFHYLHNKSSKRPLKVPVHAAWRINMILLIYTIFSFCHHTVGNYEWSQIHKFCGSAGFLAI